MPIDLERIVRAAAEAVLEGGDSRPDRESSANTKRKGLTGPRALLIGAGVYTAGRLLVRGRGLVEDWQERLIDFENRHLGGEQEPEDEDEDFDEPAEDEPEGEFAEDEPEGEFDDEELDDDELPPEDEDEDEELEDEPEEASRPSSAAGRRNGRH